MWEFTKPVLPVSVERNILICICFDKIDLLLLCTGQADGVIIRGSRRQLLLQYFRIVQIIFPAILRSLVSISVFINLQADSTALLNNRLFDYKTQIRQSSYYLALIFNDIIIFPILLYSRRVSASGFHPLNNSIICHLSLSLFDSPFM